MVTKPTSRQACTTGKVRQANADSLEKTVSSISSALAVADSFCAAQHHNLDVFFFVDIIFHW